MEKKQKFYITTPIYYPSGKWHLGHSYTTVCCDAVARFQRMNGYEVYYQTGTDEHGQKIEERAKAAGQSPQMFVDALVDQIKDLWKLLDISYDGFVRTTDAHHKKAVQEIFTKLYEKGDIYKSKYKGRYCTPCESFWTPTQSPDGKCPDCGRDTVESEEECYFFRLSKYREPLLKLLNESEFLQPSSRVNEMVNNFLKDGLEDLAVSRTSFSWGIPVPFDPKHVIYVWVDALSNYLTGLGYLGDNDETYKSFWPADIHMMAKEIVRFHAIIWPAMLMALDLPLPKKVYGHGWLLFGGDKMSKSKGNVVDPFVLCNRFGVDTVRYYLLREISFGQDSDFATENLLTRANSDLCNDLGNLVKRTTAMARQYFDGQVKKPKQGEGTEFDHTLTAGINGLCATVAKRIEKLEISKSLESVFEVVSNANKYIDLTKPWILNKEGKCAELNAVLYHLLEAIRVSANLLLPFIQNAPKQIFESLGFPVPVDFKDAVFGVVASYRVTESEPLFRRLDIQKELEELEKLTQETTSGEVSSPNATPHKSPSESVQASKTGLQRSTDSGLDESPSGLITIDEFFKTELRVAVVTACEKVEKADKLLKLTVDVGGELRTIVSGIAMSYSPDEMVGKRVVLVSNLQPAKLRGIQSEGMILCAMQDGKPVLVSPEHAVDSGAKVC